MEPIIGPVEALMLADATAKVRDENPRYDLVQLRLRRNARHSFAIATDCKFLVLARWKNGGEVCDFGVDGESIRNLLRATDEDTAPDEDGPSGLRSRVRGFRASADSVTLLSSRIDLNELLTVSVPGSRRAGRFPDINKHIDWMFNPVAPKSGSQPPHFCPVLMSKVFSVFNDVCGGGFEKRPRVRHYLHAFDDGHKGSRAESIGCWEMTFGTDRDDELGLWAMLMPLAK